MNILVVGSGGREHALGWKLQQSPLIERVFFAPGNGGTSENLPIKPNEFEKLVEFAKTNNCFTVVGPEEPLVKGIVDVFEVNGLKIFGPTKESAVLEGSKCWAKEFMRKYGIPTADFEIFNDLDMAKDYIIQKKGAPIVVKADGIAAGKGVMVCRTLDEALSAVDRIMVKKEFGEAGNRIVVEDCLSGEEASFIAITDGKTVVPLATSQDHKRVFDNDLGPNTGGMGAYSPTPVITDELYDDITKNIMQKAVDGMKKEGRFFKGFLYAGLMIKNGEPYVLEFNVRHGDPEAQPILMRMKSDLFPYLQACLDGRLEEMLIIEWDERAAVCVVMASGGYPSNYEKGKVISGLDEAMKMKDVMVFHAGTAKQNGNIATNGGRVLGVTALGNGIEEAINNAYTAVTKITWEKMHYRKDIGQKALRHLE